MATHMQDFLSTQSLTNSPQDNGKTDFSLQNINMHYSPTEWAVWCITASSTAATTAIFIF